MRHNLKLTSIQQITLNNIPTMSNKIEMKNTKTKVATKNKTKASNKSLGMTSLPRTEADIEEEISRLINDESNFISDNYGSEAADNGEYEVYFSKYTTEETLKRFAKWLLGNGA